MRFSEEDYFTPENSEEASVPVRIIKDTNVRLANPVVFRVTPLTVDEAEDFFNYVFSEENILSKQEIERSPLRASI